jgi:hypothetical protein
MPEVTFGKMLVAFLVSVVRRSASGRTLMHEEYKVFSKATLFRGEDMLSPQSNSALIEPYRRPGWNLDFC